MGSVPTPDFKPCRTCGEVKSAAEFYAAKTNADGLQNACRECVKAKVRAWNAANPDRKRETRTKWTLANADRKRATDKAWAKANPERVRAVKRVWIEGHLDVVRDAKKRWELKNPERLQASRKAWAKAHPERVRELARARYEANTEYLLAQSKAWAKANPEKRRAMDKAWVKANPEKRRLITTQRRSRKMGAEGTHTLGEWLALCSKYGNRCMVCGRDDVPMTKDHIVPLSKGGSDHVSNLQIACHPCNARKGNRHSIDYRPDGGAGLPRQPRLFEETEP